MEFQTFKLKAAQAAVIEHSLNTHTGKEIMTFWLRYWRPIHSELMTHRWFSRSAGSSRAIPVSKRLQEVRSEPAGPIYWGANKPGMQAGEELTGDELAAAKAEWLHAANKAAASAETMMELGVHKQVANRVLEPFINIDVVVTATEWDNWYELRDHEDAQPEIRDLAQVMRLAASKSKARHVTQRSIKDPRDWHLPFVSMDERKNNWVRDLIAMSAARCARTSYQNHNKADPTLEEDVGLYRRLVESRPLHASPLEHQAVVSNSDHRSSNFLGGWIQHRTMLEYAGSIDNLQQSLTDEE